ncbi:MAG: hypothetical protein IM592_15730, partial [Bacteroidetes bacterium]|nr:hypothetical protein [Bacteroidota bacterium]
MQSKLTWLYTGIAMLSITAYQAQTRNALPQGFKEQKTSGISFTENKGQVHDQNY